VILAKSLSNLIIDRLRKNVVMLNEDSVAHELKVPIISPIMTDPLLLNPVDFCEMNVNIYNVLQLSGDLSLP
jgi:hypothetical protein